MKMCYDMKCAFQDWKGNCRIWEYDKFKELFGEEPCDVGMAEGSKENQERFEQIEKEIYDKKLIRMYSGF